MVRRSSRSGGVIHEFQTFPNEPKNHSIRHKFFEGQRRLWNYHKNIRKRISEFGTDRGGVEVGRLGRIREGEGEIEGENRRSRYRFFEVKRRLQNQDIGSKR